MMQFRSIPYWRCARIAALILVGLVGLIVTQPALADLNGQIMVQPQDNNIQFNGYTEGGTVTLEVYSGTMRVYGPGDAAFQSVE
jgi:hypothetical protein